MDNVYLSLNTETIQQVVNKKIRTVNQIQNKLLRKNELYLSMNTAHIQNTVNQTYKPQSQSAYGSLFEFLDRTDIMNPENQKILKSVIKMNKDIDEHHKFERPERRMSADPQKKRSEIERKSIDNNMLLQQAMSPTHAIPSAMKGILKTHADNASIESKVNKSVAYAPDKTWYKDDRVIPKTAPTVESRVARYIRKRQLIPEKDESNYLLQLYQKDGQTTKKNYLEKHELELYEKLAMKSGHHLLRAALQIKQEENEENQRSTDIYTTSFHRVQNGLRILRNNKRTSGMFDKEGNYIKIMSQSRSNSPRVSKEDYFPGKKKKLEAGVIDEEVYAAAHTRPNEEDNGRFHSKFTYKSKDLMNILIDKDMVKWKKLRSYGGEKQSIAPKPRVKVDIDGNNRTIIVTPVIENRPSRLSMKRLSGSIDYGNSGGGGNGSGRGGVNAGGGVSASAGNGNGNGNGGGTGSRGGAGGTDSPPTGQYSGSRMERGRSKSDCNNGNNNNNQVLSESMMIKQKIKEKNREILHQMGIMSPKVIQQLLMNKKKNITQAIKIIKSSLRSPKKKDMSSEVSSMIN